MSDFTNVHESLPDEGEEYANGSDPFRDEEDLNNPNYYCEHGNFTGNPFGGDYLCGWCESGATKAEFEAYCDWQRQRLLFRNLTAEMFSAIPNGVPTGYISICIGSCIAMMKAGN
jgi:hypothetical protein